MMGNPAPAEELPRGMASIIPQIRKSSSVSQPLTAKTGLCPRIRKMNRIQVLHERAK
jgi:hypothetical protein